MKTVDTARTVDVKIMLHVTADYPKDNRLLMTDVLHRYIAQINLTFFRRYVTNVTRTNVSVV